MEIPEEDRKEILWLALFNGMLGGFMAPDCGIEELLEDVDPDIIEGFFLDE